MLGIAAACRVAGGLGKTVESMVTGPGESDSTRAGTAADEVAVESPSVPLGKVIGKASDTVVETAVKGEASELGFHMPASPELADAVAGAATMELTGNAVELASSVSSAGIAIGVLAEPLGNEVKDAETKVDELVANEPSDEPLVSAAVSG